MVDELDEVHNRLEFARQLTMAREAAGLSIRDVAAATGLTSSTVGGYFSGRHLPSAGQIHILTKILAVCGISDVVTVSRWVAAAGRARRTPGPRPADAPSPFRGLDSYQVHDQEWFFGRMDLIRMVTDRVLTRNNAVLFVVGASGSGKSSLLRAGLLGKLAVEYPKVPTVLMTPGDHPVTALAAAIADLTGDDPVAVRDTCVQDPGAALRVDQAVVVIDQFEEIFAIRVDEDERRVVLSVIAAAEATRCVVVLGMRADFYPQAARCQELVGPLQHSQVVVGPMSEPQLREVITGPASRAHVDVEDGLVELILRDLAPAGQRGGSAAHGAGALPLLSHVLLTVWHRGQRRRLTIADYTASGALHGAVEMTAEEAYGDLDPHQQLVARRMFVQLVHTDDPTVRTRRRIWVSDLHTGVAADDDAREEVLRRFIDKRLITSDADGIQVTHEALLEAWPRLNEWIDADRSGLRVYRRLREAARAWHDTNRGPDGLLRGAHLAAAQDWMANPARPVDLNRIERDFIERSIELDSDERQAARRRAGTLLRLLVLVSVLLLVSVAATVVALVQNGRANQQRHAADTARDIAVSRKVAADAAQLFVTDPALADQLAVAAYQVNPTLEARSSLLTVTAGPAVTRLRASLGTMAAASGGRVLATGDNVGSVRLWRLGDDDRPEPAGPAFPAIEGSVFAVAITQDDQLLAVAGKASAATLWDIADPARPMRLARLDTGAATGYGLAFQPGGRLLALASADHGVRLWNLAIPREPKRLADPPMNPDGDVHAITFSDDGRELLSGTPEHTVRRWRVTGTALALTGADLRGPASAVNAIAVSHDTTAVAAASSDHYLYLWAGTAIAKHAFNSFVNAVTFAPDGQSLVAGGADGAVVVMNRSDLRTMQELHHPGPVTGTIFLRPNTLLTADADGYARVWKLPGSVIRTASNQIFTVAFAGDGTLAVNAQSTAAARGGVSLWNLTGSGLLQPRGGGIASPTGAGRFSGASAISRSGGMLAVGSVDGTTAVWNVATPDHPVPAGPALTGPTQQIEALAFSPGGQYLAVGGDDHHVWIYDVADPASSRLVTRLDDPTNLVLNLAFSPDGTLLAAASADRKVYLWNVDHPAAARLLSATTTAGSYAYAVAFAPHDQLLAVGSADKDVRLYDLRDPKDPRQVGATLVGPTNYVYSVAFSPDGRTVAAGSTDGTVRLWDLGDGPGHTATPSATLTASAGVFTIAFSPDGRYLAAGTADDALFLWPTTTSAATAAICDMVGDPITPAEWQQYLPGLAYRPPCGH